MADAMVTVSVKDIPQVTALIEAARGVEVAWEQLCHCTDEFMPDYPHACDEYRDYLDTAILALLRVLNGADHAG